MAQSSKFLSISIFIYLLKCIWGEIHITSSHFQNIEVKIEEPQCDVLSIEKVLSLHSPQPKPNAEI